MSLKLKNIYIQPFLVTSVLARLATYKSTSPGSHKFFKVLRSMRSRSLRSKRFQSSYWAKVRAEAKKRLKPSFMFFCSCPSFLDEPCEETLATQARGHATNDSRLVRLVRFA